MTLRSPGDVRRADTGEMPIATRPLSASPLPLFLVGLLAFTATLVWLTGLTGASGANLLLPFLSEAWANGSVAALWWAGAIGFGLLISRWACNGASATVNEPSAHSRAARNCTSLDTLALAIPLGLAAMLALESLIATLGGLTAWRGVLAWLLPLAGMLIGVRMLRDAPPTSDSPSPSATANPVRVAFIAIHAALAALILVAATAAPGWLWSSEFGGYDAQSYHLPLAMAWTQLGSAVGPVEGNVYSALPSFVETVFAHLMILRGDRIAAAIACQWWAAIGTLFGAYVVARLARTVFCGVSCDSSAKGSSNPAIAWLASATFLATPWIVVVGTLAYNDIVPVIALAGGWLLIRVNARGESSARALDWRSAACLALIAASATGAKPTAFFFTVIPLAAIAIIETSPRVFRSLPLATVIGLAILAPWLARNWQHYENPVFPFATGLFGLGPWSAEQHTIFAAAHSPDRSILARVPLLWTEWIGYGFSELGDGGEELFPQWSAVPLLGVLGLASLLFRSTTARTACAGLAAIVVTLLAWFFLTHLKSRFLVTTAVPLSLGVAAFVTLVAGLFVRRSDRESTHAVPTALAFISAALLAIPPFANYLREPAKNTGQEGERLRAPSLSIGSIPVQTGEAVARLLADADAKGDTAMRAAILQQVSSPFAVNSLLPADARVVGVGFATPLYMRRPITTTTVWDRGPIDIVAERAPDAPATWGSLLRQRGFTHALVDPTMLEIWAKRGWLNPQLARADWVEPFGRANRVISRTVDGKVLFELAP